MHGEIQELRKEIDELKDDIKVMERGGGNFNIVFQPDDAEESGGEESSSDESSECESVQSAPASISY